jgi:hypothetical protein
MEALYFGVPLVVFRLSVFNSTLHHIGSARTGESNSRHQQSLMRVEDIAYIRRGTAPRPEGIVCDIAVTSSLTDYDGVRLCLRTAATNRPIVHPLGDMLAWRAIVMTSAGCNS